MVFINHSIGDRSVRELLEYLVQSLVDKPERVRVEEFEEDDGTLVFELSVDDEDYGRVIGRVEPHQEIGIRPGLEASDETQHGAQVGGRELAGTACAVRERGQPDGVGVIGPRSGRNGRQPGRTEYW